MVNCPGQKGVHPNLEGKPQVSPHVKRREGIDKRNKGPPRKAEGHRRTERGGSSEGGKDEIKYSSAIGVSRKKSVSITTTTAHENNEVKKNKFG